MLTYTLTLSNTGEADAAGVVITDLLPISTAYVPNSLGYPHGEGDYDLTTHIITWTGWVSAEIPVEITYQLTAPLGLDEGVLITNTVLISEAGAVHQREAVATIGIPPKILSTMPVDSASSVPITTSLTVAFSEGMEPASLYLDIEPDPGGWTSSWRSDFAVLTVSLDTLVENQTYTVTLSAADDEADPLIPGPVPNPWAFTTVGIPPVILSTTPADGVGGVPITTTLSVTFSEGMDPASLVLDIEPDPGDWTPYWESGSDVLTVSLPTLTYSHTYTVTLGASDHRGNGLIPGPVPNPWAFTTEVELPQPPTFELLLPVILK
jgi:hypothetical protein